MVSRRASRSRAHAAGWLALRIVTSLAVMMAAPGAAGADECQSLVLARDRHDLPPAWRDSLAALVRATNQRGQPWSCPGGAVELELDPSGHGALLTITDARGRRVSRVVREPEDLVPMGEALLAAPIAGAAPKPPAPPEPPPPPPAVAAPAPPPPASAPPETRPAERPREPRLQIEALVGLRYGAPSQAAWGSGFLAGTFPIGRWAVGMWARYDLPFTAVHGAPTGFGWSSVSAGLTGGRVLLTGPFEIRLTIDPSLAVVVMEAGSESEADHPEGAKPLFRVGTRLRGAFKIASVFRGVVALDGELSPAGIGGAIKIDPRLPQVPVYTAGLLLGVEAAIP